MSRKTIVITGASRGIGAQCAKLLATEDTHIILIAKDETHLQSVSEYCLEQGATVLTLSVDLQDMKAVDSLREYLAYQGRIDVLINNAGLWFEDNIMKGDMSLWDMAIDVNLNAPIHLTRLCLEWMDKNSNIIFINSIAGRKSYYGGTNYCAGKWGLLGFAGALFEDVREKGIKVCSILPGSVNTDMHKDDVKLDAQKMIQPEDVAKTVQFILSMPSHVCPTEITLMPQFNPKRS